MSDRYYIMPNTNRQLKAPKTNLIKVHEHKHECMAHFVGPDAKTNAQKVCDLLNETSRAQGK